MMLVAAATVLSTIEGMPPLGLLLFFVALVITSENRDRLFGDETSISSSIVVAIASVVVFRDSTPLLGPLLCAACAGIYWAHLRERSFAKIAVNASAIGLSALAAAGPAGLLDGDRRLSIGRLAVIVVLAAVNYWIVNTCALAAALSLLRGETFGYNARLLIRSETPMLGLAMLGGLCGLMFVRHGFLLGSISIVALLVAIDLCSISPRPWDARFISIARFICIIVLLFSASIFGTLTSARLGVVGAVCAVLAIVFLVTFLVSLVRVHRATGLWDRHLALGTAVVDVPMVAVFALAGVLAEVEGIWIGVAGLGTTLALAVVVSRRVRRRQIRADTDDHRIAAAVERAVAEGRSLPTSSH
jgi:hypothetical protein